MEEDKYCRRWWLKILTPSFVPSLFFLYIYIYFFRGVHRVTNLIKQITVQHDQWQSIGMYTNADEKRNAKWLPKSSGYERANKPNIKKKRGNKQKQTTFWKEGRGKKCLHAMGQRLDTCNLCTRYNPLSSDNNSARQLTLMMKEWAVSLHIKTTPSLIHRKWTI